MAQGGSEDRQGGSEEEVRQLKIPSAAAELAPTARKLLEAARRLVESSGYSSLSLEAIGREAGENKSLIWYHFGGKPGLLAALVDWLLYDTIRDLHDKVTGAAGDVDKQHEAITDAGRLASDATAYRAFYEVLPHLLESREGRDRLAELYAEYRRLNAAALSGADGESGSMEARAMGSMTVALVDGLAIQLLVDPGCVDLEATFRMWEDFVRLTLPKPAS